MEKNQGNMSETSASDEDLRRGFGIAEKAKESVSEDTQSTPVTSSNVCSVTRESSHIRSPNFLWSHAQNRREQRGRTRGTNDSARKVRRKTCTYTTSVLMQCLIPMAIRERSIAL